MNLKYIMYLIFCILLIYGTIVIYLAYQDGAFNPNNKNSCYPSELTNLTFEYNKINNLPLLPNRT